MERALVFLLMHYIYSTNMCCNCEANFNDIVKHLSQNSDVKYRNSYGDFLDGRLYFSRRVQNPSFNKAANRIYRERMVKQSKNVYSDANVFSDNSSGSSMRSLFRKLPVPISRYKSYEKNSDDSEFLGYLYENEPCTDKPTLDEIKEIFSSVINPVPRSSKRKKSSKQMSRKISNRNFPVSAFRSRHMKLTSRGYSSGNITERKNLTDMIRKVYFDRIKEKIYEASNYKLYEDLNLLDNDLKNQEVRIDFLKDKSSIDRKVDIKDQITFPMFYHSIGSIRLPIDDIEEPFEAWYAALFNMSRIDYYHGKQTLFVSFQ